MSETYLVHHGIKGQKWGVRRFQNDDGSVTPAGAERYYIGGKGVAGSKGGETKIRKKSSSSSEGSKNSPQQRANGQTHSDDASKRAKAKRIIGIAAGVAVTAVVAYAGYKYVKNHPEAMAGLGKKISEITGKSSNADSKIDLEKLGIETFKPETFKPETINIDRAAVDRVKIPTVNIQDSRAETASAMQKIEEFTKQRQRGDEIRDMAVKQLREGPKVQDGRAEMASAIKKMEALTADRQARDERLKEIREMTEKQLREGPKVQDKRAEYAAAIKRMKDIEARNGRGEDAARQFTWEKVARRDANGNTSYISLPTDRKGYADYFAKRMASSSGNKEGYDYWYKYIMGRMNYQ